MSFPSVKNKTICLPFESEDHYKACMEDKKEFRIYLDKMYFKHQELFPKGMETGYKLHGFITSKKQRIKMRRIKLNQNGQAYQIRPSFMMPYMIGRTDEIEKPLYLRRWGVPVEALAYVFGKDPMFWYRAYVSIGRNSIVGTTIKDPSNLPKDVLADEKHTKIKGKRAYVTTTVGQECLLGSDIAESASADDLMETYSTFKEESQNLHPEYSPETVNTDGWEPTQDSWKLLFPQITIILCFFHSFLKIRQRRKSYRDIFQIVAEKVWHAYYANSLSQFSQRIRRLREFALSKIGVDYLRKKTLDLCNKAPQFKIAFDFPDAYRTSNALDRLVNYQNRLLFAMQYFHGTQLSARLYIRAMALVWNFHPYCLKTQIKYQNRSSPFEGVNGFLYHHNWLHNLMIASSLGGRKT